MTLTHEWRYLNLTRNNVFVLFPVEDVMSKSFLAVSAFV